MSVVYRYQGYYRDYEDEHEDFESALDSAVREWLFGQCLPREIKTPEHTYKPDELIPLIKERIDRDGEEAYKL